MRTLKTCILVLALGLSSMSLAHGSHEPVSAERAKEIAKYVAVRLTEADRGMGFGILDRSWKEIPDDKVSISGSGPGYLVVALEHDAEKRTLYVLMSKDGDVYDANFSGQFQGIN